MKEPKYYIGEFEELVLLAILSLRQSAYGVKIGDAIEEATGRSVSVGALYATLSRLEEKGLIRSWMGEATAERGGRAKKYFKIEAPGQQALAYVFAAPIIRTVRSEVESSRPDQSNQALNAHLQRWPFLFCGTPRKNP